MNLDQSVPVTLTRRDIQALLIAIEEGRQRVNLVPTLYRELGEAERKLQLANCASIVAESATPKPEELVPV